MVINVSSWGGPQVASFLYLYNWSQKDHKFVQKEVMQRSERDHMDVEI